MIDELKREMKDAQSDLNQANAEFAEKERAYKRALIAKTLEDLGLEADAVNAHRVLLLLIETGGYTR